MDDFDLAGSASDAPDGAATPDPTQPDAPSAPTAPGVAVQVPPLDVDGVRTIEVGTIAWGVAFVALLPFYSSLKESGHLWWLWTCMAGLGLGLLGIEYCRRRRDRAFAPVRPARPGRPGKVKPTNGGRRRA